MTDTLQPTDDASLLSATARALLFTEARTANTFGDGDISDEQLHTIHELAKFGPTAANTQPMRVLFVRSPEARTRLVAHMNDANKAKTLAAPLVAVIAADTEFHEFIPQVFPIRPEMKDQLAGVPEVRDSMARFNAALQAGYFLMAVRAEGLAAGPMTGYDAAGVDEEFFADGRWKSLMVVNIGRPAEAQWPRLPRLDFDDVARIV